VDIEVEEHTAGALYFHRAADLSDDGLYLAGTLPHPPGTEIELDVALSGGAPLRLRGRVAGGRRTIGMGVRFVDVSEEARSQITEYLARRRLS
jgi:hypothetical protein